MTTTDDITHTIKAALRDNPTQDVISVVLGNFVALMVALVDRQGLDPDKAIRISGAPGRDVTIHATDDHE